MARKAVPGCEGRARAPRPWPGLRRRVGARCRRAAAWLAIAAAAALPGATAAAALSMSEALRQNSKGNSEGEPAGVPISYDWYAGVQKARPAPPPGFSAVTAWGQVYQNKRRPSLGGFDGKVEVARVRTYVHDRIERTWRQVQASEADPIAGGFFRADFTGGGAGPMPISRGEDGTVSFAAPPEGSNNHFWPVTRGTFPAGSVDGVYVQMDLRVTDPRLGLIANVGADWWRDETAEFVQGFANNPGSGMSNWVELRTEWRTLSYCSSNELLLSDPPPPVRAEASHRPRARR
ncbi:hypothetical protein [Methylobacterium sp. WSM2598]|uniref:hypothetical protein n=1 Tax=Methylobacterium sp. WSM2598 TaxID=398261 RepID=UPI00035EB054|nr:hypothetical protein [Methylobacterium sp. WSM2598]